eukprot:5839860-Prorocentrum_lima.AAC.1
MASMALVQNGPGAKRLIPPPDHPWGAPENWKHLRWLRCKNLLRAQARTDSWIEPAPHKGMSRLSERRADDQEPAHP